MLISPEIPNTDFKFYKAILFKNGSSKDNRCQVRIIPKMAFIEETEYLPWYPTLFKGNVITGWAESDPDRPENQQPEILMVIATEDFNYGFIVGKMNNFGGVTTGDTFSYNYGFNQLKKWVSSVGGPMLTFKDLVVQNFTMVNSNDKDEEKVGGFLEAYNYKTGMKIIFNAAGYCVLIDQKQILLQIYEKDKFNNFIQLTPESISFRAPTITFDADRVFLSHNRRFVLGSPGATPINCCGESIVATNNDLVPKLGELPKGVYV